MKLKNKVAIVTGGSRGIGRAVAEAFLKNGARVMLAARSRAELAATKTALAPENAGSVETFAMDVSKKGDAKALVAATVKTFGGLDILVNGAGIYGAIGAAEDVDFEAWKAAFDVNLFGTFNMIQEAVPIFKKAGHGKIINFSGGGEGPLPHFSAYTASKSAVVRLTESLAAELKDRKIDVNAVAPGAVNTKILEDALSAGEQAVGKEMYAKLLQQKKEGGVPAAAAGELCVFLASEDSDGLSGKLVSAVWDKWNTWGKDDIARLMQGNGLTFRRMKP